MNGHHKTALDHHCRFAFETCQSKFNFVDGPFSVMLTVNSGWE